MEFPISRQRLQDIRKEIEDDILKRSVDSVVDRIKYSILSHTYSPFPEHLGGITKTKLKININYNFRFDKDPLYMYPNPMNHPLPIYPWKTHSDVILGKLQTLFPDVSFNIDILKTYILVDWS